MPANPAVGREPVTIVEPIDQTELPDLHAREMEWLQARIDEATETARDNRRAFLARSAPTTDTFTVVWNGAHMSLAVDRVLDFQRDDVNRVHPLFPHVSPDERKRMFRDTKGHSRPSTEEAVEQAKTNRRNARLAKLMVDLAKRDPDGHKAFIARHQAAQPKPRLVKAT